MKVTYLFLLTLLFPLFVAAQDVYEVKFTTGVTQYRAALVLWNNGTGRMRLRFYSNGRTNMVEQLIYTESTKFGTRLTGYNPVYPGTTTKYPTYAADNFYLSLDENGNASMTNIDDNDNVSSCYIRSIKGSYAIKNFLRDFSWQLD